MEKIICGVCTCTQTIYLWPYCINHASHIWGVIQKPSTHPKLVHESGLFATSNFRVDDVVTHYSSQYADLIVLAGNPQYKKQLQHKVDNGNLYLLETNKPVILLDSKSIINFPGRFLNDPTNSTFTPNCGFCNDSHTKFLQGIRFACISIRALVDISIGDELFVEYGSEYIL